MRYCEHGGMVVGSVETFFGIEKGIGVAKMFLFVSSRVRRRFRHGVVVVWMIVNEVWYCLLFSLLFGNNVKIKDGSVVWWLYCCSHLCRMCCRLRCAKKVPD